MPRGKHTHPPDNLRPSEYPAWFDQFGDEQQNGDAAINWLRDYEGDDLRQLVLSVLSSGGALLLGTTRDGGALRITVMFGEKRKTSYATSADELDIIMQKLG